MIELILALLALAFGVASVVVIGIGCINVLRIRQLKSELKERRRYWNDTIPENLDEYFKKARQERLEALKKSHNCKEHSICTKCTGGTGDCEYKCGICGKVWEGPCNFEEDFS